MSVINTAVNTDVITEVRKRDGRIVPFDVSRIENAIGRALKVAEEGNDSDARAVADKVWEELLRVKKLSRDRRFLPSIELIQDIVEQTLISSQFGKTAKAYIIYRQKRAELRAARGIVPADVRELADKSKVYFKNPLGEFIYYRSYSKWIPEKGRRETWIETVDRYMAFMREILGNKLEDSLYSELREGILKHEAMPSMRLLQFAGTPAKITNVCAYNCSYIAPTTFQDLAEIMYISMCGGGAGWSVESQNVQKFPQIELQDGTKLPTFVIADSKEGWCDALAFGLRTWAGGADVEFDYSQIRSAGARLKTMGGRASGPEPLRRLLSFSRERMFKRQGKRLTNLDVHDIICMIGDCVVSGGVRRSAMISLSDLDDEALRDSKKGAFYATEPQRMLANNSAVYREKPSSAAFMKEWLALMESGSGERGIFNRGILTNILPKRRIQALREYQGYFDASGQNIIGAIGTNPCVPRDTWVMTKEGPKKVGELIGRQFTAIVDGESHQSTIDGFFQTGEKKLTAVKTEEGFTFKATNDHPVLVVEYKSRKIQRNAWKKVGELRMGDKLVLHNHRLIKWEGDGNAKEGWLLGNLYGDGNIEANQKANLDYWGIGQAFMMEQARELIHAEVGGRSDLAGHVAKTGYGRVQSVQLGRLALTYGMTSRHKFPDTERLEHSSSEFYEGFLRGWFDADGSVQGNTSKGVSVRLSSSVYDSLQVAQRMLGRLGVISTLYENRRGEQDKLMPDGRGGVKMYHCKSQHELIISKSNIRTFSERVGFSDPQKKERLSNILKQFKRVLNQEAFSARVTSITEEETESVYDCTIPSIHAFDGNGFMLHNCGEIILQSKQFCNLSEIVARPEDTKESLLRKVRLAAILGTFQATLTNFPYLSSEWKDHCERERLLGVSITGQWDCLLVRESETLDLLREEAIKVNEKFAAEFCINAATAITCVKPSGTLSQMVDSSSGMHPRHSPHYIRRIRIAATDSLFKMLRDQGIPFYPEVGQEKENVTTFVLEFPVKAPEGSVFKNDISALEQLEHWKIVRTHFTEHNPSVTISVGENEWLAVADWLYKNWNIVCGLSFLPRDNHVYRLAPYEEIDNARYEELKKNWEQVDFSEIMAYEKADEQDLKRELACVGGVCEI